ncbi:MAG TPA: DNA helicase, partial [Thermomicrobiales bacterium]|nr:DNA helicase [Thermomicrobiales bacterium]
IRDRKLVTLSEYRAVDYLPDEISVPVPAALIEPAPEVADPLALVSPEELATLIADVERRELPDLDRIAAEHREKESARASARITELESRRGALTSDLDALLASRIDHPFADPKARKVHQRSLRLRDALDKERNALAEVLQREIDAEDLRIRDVIRGIRDVLHRFGYLRQGYPTEKADMLADIFDTDGLILCELIDRGTLDNLAPEELAELFSWFSFDREYRYANHFTLPDRLVAARRRLEDLEHDVLGEERDLKLFISEGHNPSFYGAALHWSRGWTMSQIGDQMELSEGDLVLTFNKTIDLMRQVREMLIGVAPEHPLRHKLVAAEKLLRRGIVEQSLSLGFSPIAEIPEDDREIADDDIDTAADEAATLN